MSYFAAQRLAIVLLAVTSLIVAAGAVTDLRERRSSPETIVRGYFAALEGGDEDAALAALAPAVREDWTAFVENSLNNTYRVSGIAVRQPSFLERLQGAPAAPTDLTVFLDITQWADGVRWQAGPEVDILQADGRWYLAKPPLA
jgi:hypothetical protein